MDDDVGVTLIARNPDDSVAASKWLPGSVTKIWVKEEAARFAEETGLPVEVGAHGVQEELLPTHIGRPLPETHSRLMPPGVSSVTSKPVTGVAVRPQTLLPRHLRG